MDEELRRLIRQAQQNDDPGTNLRLAQALDRSGHLAEIFHEIDHQPSYPISIEIGTWLHGHPYSIPLQIQPMNHTTVILRGRTNAAYHSFPWIGLPQPELGHYTFSLLSHQDARKQLFNAIDLAGFLESWGPERQLFWLPLKSLDPEAYEHDSTVSSTLPRIDLGGPQAPAIYRADILSQGIVRDFADSIERWVDDHLPEMQQANKQWNLYEVALQLKTYKKVLSRLKQEEAALNKRVSDWLHNKW